MAEHPRISIASAANIANTISKDRVIHDSITTEWKTAMLWDVEKNRIDIRKHKISFEEALSVFDDPNCVEIFDESHSIDVDRYVCIGDIGGYVIVVVVFTGRDGSTRLISARRADREEEELYYEHIKRTLGRN